MRKCFLVQCTVELMFFSKHLIRWLSLIRWIFLENYSTNEIFQFIYFLKNQSDYFLKLQSTIRSKSDFFKYLKKSFNSNLFVSKLIFFEQSTLLMNYFHVTSCTFIKKYSMTEFLYFIKLWKLDFFNLTPLVWFLY